MKSLKLYLVLICLLPLALIAGEQNVANHNGPVHQYVTKNIMPVVVAKRKAFDVVLSSSEQTQLAIYRNELKELHQSHSELMQKSWGNPSESSASVSNDEARKTFHEQMKEVNAKVRVIAENHKAELDKIMSDLQPQREIWKNDITNIRAKQNENSEKEESTVSSSHFNYGGHNRMLNRVNFLLMNSSETITADNERQAEVSEILSASAMPSLDFYPNPSVDQFTINLNAIPEQNMLQITDVTGKVVFEKNNVMTTETIPCNSLNNGIYFVRLISDDQILNKKLVINH
jgi:hypothetical protein